MSIYDSRLWAEDIDKVIEFIPWIEGLTGKRVMITGIGGLVGSAIADILIRYNETHDQHIYIIAAGRSEERIKSRFGSFFERDYFRFVYYDATEFSLTTQENADYIIHGASNSSPDKIGKEPVETMLSNVLGLNALLRYAKSAGTKRVLYISSSEVYGKKEGNEPFTEEQYGYIDLLNPRNSYSVGKRAAETLCSSYSDEYGVDTVIVRPGHIYGPNITSGDKHVSSQWAYAAAEGQNIIMKSEGTQLRSYCHCLDTASAILTVLIKGESNHAYNISNPDSVITIRQMAEIIAKSSGVDLIFELPSEEERKTFNPMNNSSLDSTGLLKLGWNGVLDAEKGFAHTIQVIKEARK